MHRRPPATPARPAYPTIAALYRDQDRLARVTRHAAIAAALGLAAVAGAAHAADGSPHPQVNVAGGLQAPVPPAHPQSQVVGDVAYVEPPPPITGPDDATRQINDNNQRNAAFVRQPSALPQVPVPGALVVPQPAQPQAIMLGEPIAPQALPPGRPPANRP